MDFAIDFENHLTLDAAEEGTEDGARQGRSEGHVTGQRTGWQLGLEIGFYQGCLRQWGASSTTVLKPRQREQLAEVVALLHALTSLDATARDSGFAALLTDARSKFKRLAVNLKKHDLKFAGGGTAGEADPGQAPVATTMLRSVDLDF